MTTVYRADCDQFDDHETGYYATPEEAIAAFWSENWFSDSEKARVVVYTTMADSDDPDVIDRANYLAENCASPSPALGITL